MKKEKTQAEVFGTNGMLECKECGLIDYSSSKTCVHCGAKK